ncbi:hypothetical protein B0J15DRAFT_468336 [Fusarium solani]|uniref:Uncharacterized protein n=1 Tax=Fusarium solani TaxID=169388 RepID=A0A9P9GZQ4_FUSSL|nr:uncharacterized protein B0J15DRAFT_468336 [Fusarium solani]KAH7248326.1 hypothetical protein B0J15DRAFT_468336 [Fusarium solani]
MSNLMDLHRDTPTPAQDNGQDQDSDLELGSLHGSPKPPQQGDGNQGDEPSTADEGSGKKRDPGVKQENKTSSPKVDDEMKDSSNLQDDDYEKHQSQAKPFLDLLSQRSSLGKEKEPVQFYQSNNQYWYVTDVGYQEAPKYIARRLPSSVLFQHVCKNISRTQRYPEVQAVRVQDITDVRAVVYYGPLSDLEPKKHWITEREAVWILAKWDGHPENLECGKCDSWVWLSRTGLRRAEGSSPEKRRELRIERNKSGNRSITRKDILPDEVVDSFIYRHAVRLEDQYQAYLKKINYSLFSSYLAYLESPHGEKMQEDERAEGSQQNEGVTLKPGKEYAGTHTIEHFGPPNPPPPSLVWIQRVDRHGNIWWKLGNNSEGDKQAGKLSQGYKHERSHNDTRRQKEMKRLLKELHDLCI